MQEAAEVSVAAPTISGSLDARYISGKKEERVIASTILTGPGELHPVDKKKVSSKFELLKYFSIAVSPWP